MKSSMLVSVGESGPTSKVARAFCSPEGSPDAPVTAEMAQSESKLPFEASIKSLALVSPNLGAGPRAYQATRWHLWYPVISPLPRQAS